MKFILTGDQVYAALNGLTAIGSASVVGTTGLKIARITKAVRTAALEIQDEREKLRAQYAVRFPADHPTHAGQYEPVYVNGTKEADRRPDNEAAIVPGAWRFTDTAVVTAALVALGKSENEIDCPSLTSDELAALNLTPASLEALLWNIDAEQPVDVRPDARRRHAAARRAP